MNEKHGISKSMSKNNTLITKHSSFSAQGKEMTITVNTIVFIAQTLFWCLVRLNMISYIYCSFLDYAYNHFKVHIKYTCDAKGLLLLLLLQWRTIET